jgi:hypothetical protein
MAHMTVCLYPATGQDLQARMGLEMPRFNA